MPLKLTPAEIYWRDEAPWERSYSDAYYSRHDGSAESRYVFLQGNSFPERWQQQNNWTIAETGFGTGLNFLCCWKQWQEHANPNSRLTFISTEMHPLTIGDLRSTLEQWSDLKPLVAELIANWPAPIGGFHNLTLDNGRVKLLLLFGDSAHCYSQLDAPIDAWFLDGFTPSRNPEMWRSELFDQIGRLSHHRTTLATFTAASFVRHGLGDAGFSMSKRRGYRYKRDMLVGQFEALTAENTPAATKVAVIGGGLAGCSVAYSLAIRGVTVDLYESDDHLAASSSGIPAAVTRPFLDKSLSPAARLSIDGFAYTRQLLKKFGIDRPQGALWTTDELWAEIPAALGELQAPSEICPSPTMLFPDAQTTDVSELCHSLVQHSNIRCHFNSSVSALSAEEGEWNLTVGEKVLHYSDIVVCSGAVPELLSAGNSQLSSRPIRGQLSGYETDLSPPHIICGHGHVSRFRNLTWTGASFVPGDTSVDIRDRDREVYAEKVAELTNNWSAQLSTQTRVDWAGIRNTTADHLPLAGQLACTDKLNARYRNSRPRRGADIAKDCRKTGLFVSLAHGSRGTVTAPICGEMIAAAICNEACPLPIPVRRAIDPAREAIKQFRQQ